MFVVGWEVGGDGVLGDTVYGLVGAGEVLGSVETSY